MSTPFDPTSVFVVIPAFNEEAVINEVIGKLLPYKYSLVIVDDGSAIPLRSIIDTAKVNLLRHKINLGQGAALQTGIEFALSRHAEYIVSFDADGQHEASGIAILLEPLIGKKAGIVFGSRLMKGGTHNMPAGRNFWVQSGRIVNFLFTGLYLSDAHNGLRAMTGETALLLHIRENGMAHASEILIQVKKNKIAYMEVPVRINYSDYSIKKGQKGSHSLRIVFDLILNKFFK